MRAPLDVVHVLDDSKVSRLGLVILSNPTVDIIIFASDEKTASGIIYSVIHKSLEAIGWMTGEIRCSVEFCGGPRLAEAVKYAKLNTKSTVGDVSISNGRRAW